MKEKKLTAFLVFISLALCISLALSAVTLAGQQKTIKKINEFNGLTDDVNQEDDVKIAGEYVIKSTLPISDAYKSGDTSKLNDNQKETLDMAKEVLDEIIEDGMSDYEKEKAVYEYLTSTLTSTTGILTVIPTGNGENDNPHDVLKYHSAVCVGYATTFRMFMQMLDIECKVIHSSDLVHSWDLVKLDDGWYHTDCYMDSGSCNYRNFNMDDNRCSNDHNWTREYFPAAEGKKYNYIFSACEELEDIYAIPDWLVEAMDNRETLISCTFKEEINEENESAAQYMVETLTSYLNEEPTVEYDWLLNNNSKYVLCFYITYSDDGVPSYEVDDETAERIDEAISKALGDDFDMSGNFEETTDFNAGNEVAG